MNKNEIEAAIEFMEEDMRQDRTLDQILQPHTETIISCLKAQLDNQEPVPCPRTEDALKILEDATQVKHSDKEDEIDRADIGRKTYKNWNDDNDEAYRRHRGAIKTIRAALNKPAVSIDEKKDTNCEALEIWQKYLKEASYDKHYNDLMFCEHEITAALTNTGNAGDVKVLLVANKLYEKQNISLKAKLRALTERRQGGDVDIKSLKEKCFNDTDLSVSGIINHLSENNYLRKPIEWRTIEEKHIGTWCLVAINQIDSQGEATSRHIVVRGFIDSIKDKEVLCISDIGECNPRYCSELPEPPTDAAQKHIEES